MKQNQTAILVWREDFQKHLGDLDAHLSLTFSENLVPDGSFYLWQSQVMESLEKNRTTANWTRCRVNFPQCARDADRQANGPTGKELGPAPKMYLSSSCRFFFSCSGIKLTCFDWWIMSKDCPVCSVWNTSFYLCVLEHSVLSSEHFFGKSVLEVTAKHKSFRVQSCSSPTQQGLYHWIQLGAVASY